MESLEAPMSQETIKGRRNSSDTILNEAKLGVQLFAVGAHNSHDHVRMSSDVPIKAVRKRESRNVR
jgi:hypothetical protein